MYRRKTIAVVVPAYNEQAHIAATLSGIPGFVDAVYVVDDGSTDRTADIVRTATALAGSGLRVPGSSNSSPVGVGSHTDPSFRGVGGPRVELIQHAANAGVGAAIVTGYKRALADGMDIAVVMAGDNQMEPEWLPAVLDPVVEGCADYSKGTRQTSLAHLRGMSMWRTAGNLTLRWLTAIASGNPTITDPQQGYAAITRGALQSLDLDAVYPYYGYCNDLIVRLSVRRMRIVEVPMPCMYHGEVSKIRYHRYIPKVSWLLVRLFLLRITGELNARRPAQPPDASLPHSPTPALGGESPLRGGTTR